MGVNDTNIESERQLTDESLRTEREKTDQAIISKKKVLENEADVVILKAREDADKVLAEARERADEKMLYPEEAHTASALSEERVVEDENLQLERDSADKKINQERQEVDKTLRRLLPLEREATDRTLLTERARSDSALENRDDFLGIVCHDLRDLLSGIVTHTELLLQVSPEDGSGALTSSTALQIQRYAARMNRLIGDLVDVASIDTGKVSVVPEYQDTTLVIEEIAQAFTASADKKSITINIEGVQNAVFTSFDHERLLQVFANLLTNSIKFTAAGGTITIDREEKGQEIYFIVTDTGVGIPSEMLQLVFERFWQVGKNDRRGLGLGLYISKCIIESHGGRIWVESTPGEGSKFIFTLPVSSV